MDKRRLLSSKDYATRSKEVQRLLEEKSQEPRLLKTIILSNTIEIALTTLANWSFQCSSSVCGNNLHYIYNNLLNFQNLLSLKGYVSSPVCCYVAMLLC